MSGISTHILDTASGKPAAGVRVRLLDAASREIATGATDENGRCRSLLPSNETLVAGNYCLRFEIGAYFPAGFFPEVAVQFRIDNPGAHYHVPLLISPFGYSTYRGS